MGKEIPLPIIISWDQGKCLALPRLDESCVR